LLADESVDLESMQPRWREFMKILSEIADNLVVRLISNDLKAQFVDQMMRLGIRPDVKRSSIKRFISLLRVSINKNDGELASAAMLTHFEELRTAMSEAIGLKASEIRKMAV